ncbi:MAG: hypothetical protein JWM90_1732 [Thermoleophilia bacterium]|nr:hypothetical protein [Thermoleophilia bacterium]
MHRFHVSALPLVVLLLAFASATLPSNAIAANGERLVTLANCRAGAPHPDGSRRQSFERSKELTGLSGIPPRVVIDVEEGRRQQVCFGYQNLTSGTISLELVMNNVGVDANGTPLSQPSESEYGAADWVALPTNELRDLRPGEVAWLTTDVDVPADVAPGSWYASVTATRSSDAPGTEDEGSRVVPVPAVTVQLFFDVPGDGTRGGNVNNARAPRVVWWDGLNIDTLPVLDRLRGIGFAPVRFDWRNGGSYTDTVNGTVTISSSLSGKVVERIEVPEKVVLRDTERAFVANWQRNIPMIGRFDAVIEMRGSDGTTVKHELPAIWVVPAWWYFLVLAIALATPITLRKRSSRRYNELVARVEAAEARAGESDVDDYSEDEWSERFLNRD